jgi:voltage-gated potassium channel Kch
VNVTLLSTSPDVDVTTTVETLSWEPTVVCKKLDEDRSPYAEVGAVGPPDRHNHPITPRHNHGTYCSRCSATHMPQTSHMPRISPVHPKHGASKRLSPPAQIEYFCIIVFTIEFLLRICSCSADAGVLRFCVSIMNVVDILAIMPWWVMSIQTWTHSGGNDSLKALAVLRVLRLSRVMRVFKMSRKFTGLILLGQTFKKSASALIMLFLFVMMSLVVFATLMFNAESGTWDPVRLQFVREDGQPSPFESIPRTMWWCIVTMTTVGYGDDTPITVRVSSIGACSFAAAPSDLNT